MPFIRTLLVISLLAASLQAHAEKTRTIILADMGNELDEEQQMIHMLMYSNEFQLEGLIAVSGKFLNSGRTDDEYKSKLHPELFNELITEYGKVRPNLMLHAAGWPTEKYLKSIVRPGLSAYGIAAVGKGNANSGTNLILESIKNNLSKGKLYIVANAGTNSLAQALFDLNADDSISDADKKVMIERIYVFENGAQDNAGAWIARHYPTITWYRSNRQTYAYGGMKAGRDKKEVQGNNVWEPFPKTPQGQHQWTARHIQNNHGPLGARFPDRFKGNGFMEGGGTISWIGLANKGLFNPWKMWWGGWGGRVSKVKHKNVMSRHKNIVDGIEFKGTSFEPAEKTFKDFYMYEADSERDSWADTVYIKSYFGFNVPVWRFRRPMWNDFRARMDWCVKKFSEANHNPIAHLNGDTSDNIMIMDNVIPGTKLSLSANGSSDPDGDALTYRWWNYKEAGTYASKIAITDNDSINTNVTIPKDASGSQIHIILEVRDHKQEIASTDSDEVIPLTDYRRLVINVK